MKNLLWFHAFDRTSLPDVLTVLVTGARPRNPGDPAARLSKTAASEALLGLPPSVYAYLGRTGDTFGMNAFVLPAFSPSGFVSPFDTGGVVHHIAPVCTWNDEQKKAFVDGYTWPTTDLEGLLAAHPSKSSVVAYVTGATPAAVGPHEVWSSGPKAPIWKGSPNSWQAWTWELRSTNPLGGVNTITAWTCPSSMLADLLEFAEKQDEEVPGFEQLMARYVPGGVSQLWDACRNQQGAS